MFNHVSVLLDELVDSLNINKSGIYVDCTLGGGGHAYEILNKLDDGLLIGIDQDEDAIRHNEEKFKNYKNIKIVKDNFININKILNDLNIKEVDGIYMDLGVSSYQFDEKDRGFSYKEDAVLDMRMDRNKNISARDIVNDLSEKELADIIWQYGEEKFARSIARHIVERRKIKSIDTTLDLVDIIKESIPAKYKRDKHPAKKTFQALRIYVNDELNILDDAIDKTIDLLKNNGRLSIITFHSLEDRIVKNKFRNLENPCTCPKGYPCVCGKKPLGKIITKKAIVPSEEEMIKNKRSHSAKLRVFERRKDAI